MRQPTENIQPPQQNIAMYPQINTSDFNSQGYQYGQAPPNYSSNLYGRPPPQNNPYSQNPAPPTNIYGQPTDIYGQPQPQPQTNVYGQPQPPTNIYGQPQPPNNYGQNYY